MKGLTEVISISVVHYQLKTQNGWHFSSPEDTPGCTVDPHLGAQFLRELYMKAYPNYSGRITVPVLWDKKTQTIVNNESAEILRMMSTAFNQWSPKPELNFYPVDLQREIDEVNDSGEFRF